MARTRRKVGSRVKTPKGHGRVTSVHHGKTFYGVSHPGGVSYFPASQVNDPDNDNDVDTPGQPDVDAAPAT